MANETYDWDGAIQNEVFEQEPFFIPEIYELECSKSAEEFHRRLGKMIFNVSKYNDDEVKYLSELVSNPWKGKKGPKFKESRLIQIQMRYMVPDESGAYIRRVDAINDIIDKYRMNAEAAAKLYDQARGPRRKKEEIIDDL